MITSSDCKLVERLSDEVVFRKRKVTSAPPSQNGGFTCASNKVSGQKDVSGKRKFRSLLRLSSYIYLPILLAAGVVQYYGGVNETIVELMSYTYYNYGLLHGGDSVYVDTKYGRLRGFTSVTREGREFYEFCGISYAQPPVGSLRFQVRHISLLSI